MSEASGINIPQFRNPSFYVSPFWIVSRGLSPRILNPEIGSSVRTGPSAPLPAAVVRRDIAINQLLHEVFLSFPPIQMEIFREKHGYDHPNPIMHVAGGIQLPHPSIHDGKSGRSFTPSRQFGRRLVPFQARE